MWARLVESARLQTTGLGKKSQAKGAGPSHLDCMSPPHCEVAHGTKNYNSSREKPFTGPPRMATPFGDQRAVWHASSPATSVTHKLSEPMAVFVFFTGL